jgi:hypothetical protein
LIEHSLPEDMAAWPQNPFAILGVQPGCTPRDLKRNYVHLIRTYKPEHHPDQFRRIREAYEFVLRMVEQFGDSAPTALHPGSSSHSEDAVSTRSAPVARATDEQPKAATPTPLNELDQIWEQAIAGEEALAYDRLREMANQNAAQSSVYIRLYWLLSLNGEIDPDRDPRDWLVDAVCAAGGAGPALELYRREVTAFPGEALRPRFERLLTQPVDSDQFGEILAWRIEGLVDVGNWSKLGADLAWARTRLQTTNEAAWLQYLLAVVTHLAWSPAHDNEAVWRACQHDLRSVEHMAARSQDAFDRFDYLTVVRANLHALCGWPGVPRQLIDLLACSGRRPFSDVDEKLQKLIAAIDDRPIFWLDVLDIAVATAPAAVAQFSVLLRHLENREEVFFAPPPDNVVAALTADFLRKHPRFDYGLIRGALISFCGNEGLAPEWIAQAIQQGHVPGLAKDHELGQLVDGDWSLHHVCWARRLVWA